MIWEILNKNISVQARDKRLFLTFQAISWREVHFARNKLRHIYLNYLRDTTIEPISIKINQVK